MSVRILAWVLALGAGLAASLVVRPSLLSRLTSPEPSEAAVAAECCTDKPEAPDRAVAAELDTAEAAPEATGPLSRMVIPDAPLLDQRGRPVRFYSDLVQGRRVAINFIFTTCRGVCPPMGATFGKLARDLGEQGVRLISVSVDPVNDTPERLAAWAGKFGSSADWTLVTGEKQDVDGLLRALGVFTADKANHSPLILLGNDRTGTWRRVHGLSSIETIRAAIDSARDVPDDQPKAAASDTSPEPISPAHRYFSDVALQNQHGETVRLYSDLLRGKVVVIHVFFASCKNTCPLMMATYQKLQEHLGDRLGRDVHLISLTVDPDRDDRRALDDYARRLGARRGWHFLTGSRPNLETALGKLGLSASRPEDHLNIFLIGNEPTQLWKKVRGLAPAEQIIEILDGVMADSGEPSRPDSGTPARTGE